MRRWRIRHVAFLAAARVRRRLPQARVVVVSAIPRPTLDGIEPKHDRKRGDWLVYTLK